ncbi:hypothetical protein [Mucilaginibacter gilvus]|nr:hypothetical protein [Mucilaginibacter gilvus]
MLLLYAIVFKDKQELQRQRVIVWQYLTPLTKQRLADIEQILGAGF